MSLSYKQMFLVHSYGLQSAYYRMFNEVAAQTGCYPYMFLTAEDFSGLTSAQFRNLPFVRTRILPNGDIVFLPPRMNRPDTSFFTRQEHPILPGFNITIADRHVEFNYPDWAQMKRLQMSQPAPCRDWAFDDNDEEFEDYDYADDEENFARDDRDMARALATKGPNGEQIDEEDMPTNAN